MSIFIDSGAFIAYYNKRDQFHDLSIQLFNEIEKNSFGYAITSDYVLNEATTRVLLKISKEKAIELGKKIFEQYPTIHVTEQIFEEAWEKFTTLKPLSLTDCTNLCIMENHNIDYIFTFDHHFKGFVKTIGVK